MKGNPADLRVQRDESLEEALRPSSLDAFVGQSRIKERLAVLVEAARRRREPLPHLLFSGPPGLGKTTLAHILAKEIGANLRLTSGPALERAADLAGLLSGLEAGDILFVDEIHRLSRTVEEYLYPAMEDFRIDIVIDQGPAARSVCLSLPRFSLFGATTRAGMLTAPLRGRFGLVNRVEYYGAEELVEVVRRSARILGVETAESGAWEIARRSRGTPRLANNLIRWVRDYAVVRAGGEEISEAVVHRALEMLDIDADGLDEMDKKLLETIIYKFEGGPVGLSTLAVAVGEDAGTIEEVHEPYLILEGFLQRTPQGRIATERAYQKLGLRPGHRGSQSELF
ncbi:Holliday junction ATP-dependent DNA helicase RuvB [Methylacidimicrobium cyclopophantes]|uniref:Holliday junction branch migration complex subunit RuvB n=1 Tax=Methylacidimicrobium cyclopophantes TaxID=1041766 RepID=A0A5E6M5J4_9BACT|nr:Holliday junction branch migration DNA helicase RuvB [Methylacidimicrobium cyclopophantes]VVM04588.1 Holliday junction ATP-dependent DNA helicase RuvB [Methylacidimicrobium cyclopophantes]